MQTSYRRQIIKALATLAFGVLPFAALAAYPERPIRIIVPFAPAGATDVLGRMVAQKLTEMTGTPIVVENKPGAGGITGMDAVAKAEPDGYTLGMIITSHAISVSLQPKPPYDVQKDLTMLSVLTLSNNVLVISPIVPANNVKELLNLGRDGKLDLSYASSGPGTTPHLSGELLRQMSGVDMTHIPYRGAGPAMVDVLGGRVPMMFDAITTAEPHIRSGKVKAIAVTGVNRSPLLKDVPTMQEAGLKDFVVDGWLGLAVPAKTPPEVIKFLSERIRQIMASPDMQAWVQSQGMSVANYSPAQSDQFLRNNVQLWEGIVKKSKAEK